LRALLPADGPMWQKPRSRQRSVGAWRTDPGIRRGVGPTPQGEPTVGQPTPSPHRTAQCRSCSRAFSDR
jgi:hypothetical protein